MARARDAAPSAGGRSGLLPAAEPGRPRQAIPRWPAGLLGGAAFLAVALTIGDPGVTWDEPNYLDSARLETAWLANLPARALDGSLSSWVAADTLERYWSFNYANPHPPLYKVLSGATWAAFHRHLGDFASFRLASAALFGVLVGVICWWGVSAGGSLAAGVGAGLSLALMPRVFGDAHIAATDMPLTAFWLVATWFFWRAARGGRWRDVLGFGLVWGMALATKFTAVLLPVPLVAWGIVFARRSLLRTLIPATGLAVALRVVLDPSIWLDPLGGLVAFIEQSTTRAAWAPIWTYYLGRIYTFVLPWHHSLVLTLATVPLPLIVLAFAGALRVRERALRPIVALCLLEIAFYQLLMAMPSSPNHDGVRLFLPQFPFLALIAGLGFAGVWRIVSTRTRAAARVAGRTFGRRGARRIAVLRAGLCAVSFLPPAAALASAHPFELAYYGELVGGARGAFRRGFETTYWWDAATPEFLERMQRRLPPGAHVWVSGAPFHFERLQEAGLVRRDLVFTDTLPAEFLLMQTRQGLFGPFEWRLLRDVRPVLAETYEGVPLIALYTWE